MVTGLDFQHFGGGIHVPLNNVATESVSDSSGALEVYLGAGLPGTSCRVKQRFFHHVSAETGGSGIDDREAHTTDRDGVSVGDVVENCVGRDFHHCTVTTVGDGGDGTNFFNEPCEHQWPLSCCGRAVTTMSSPKR